MSQRTTKIITIFVGILAISNLAASKEYKNLCYDYQDPSGWDMKTKLTNFAKGPCAPVLIVPGISGSKLNVEIDCALLKSSDPNLFSKCGWNSCTKGLLKVVPKPEYRIWIPAPLDPMSIITPFKSSKQCFAGLIEPEFDFSTGKMVFKPKPGVTIKPVGATPESNLKSNGHCAYDGVQDLLKGLPNDGTTYMKGLREQLELMGYETGLTMQALPYDWRLISGMDKLSQGYLDLLRQMKALTNKKITIIAHSMGNLRTADLLWSMTQDDKDNLIGNWVSAAPPFLGSGVDVLMLTCGADEFQFAFGLGLDWDTYKASVGSFPSVLQLMPYPTYTSQSGTQWMQQIMNRIRYEDKQSSEQVFSFFPSRDQQCYPDFAEKNCRSGLEMFDNFGSMEDGTPITNNNLKSSMEQYSFYKNIGQAWESRDQKHETLPNFGVPITLIYINVAPTPNAFHFKTNPKNWANSKGNFCTEDGGVFTQEDIYGDQVVPTTSAVTVGVKMAIDFQNGVKGAKPVKFVDFCSKVNTQESPFDTIGENGEKLMTENGYVGLPCNCSNDDFQNCNHNSMFKTPELVTFLANTLDTGSRSEITPEMAGKSAEYFQDWVDHCRLFNNHVAELTRGFGFEEVKLSVE